MFLVLILPELHKKSLEVIMNTAYYLRLTNVLLSGLVAGLCFLKIGWEYKDRVRISRIVGLGLICISIAWGSFARRFDTFKPWVPLVTLGLLFCFYGMRRVAIGERTTRIKIRPTRSST